MKLKHINSAILASALGLVFTSNAGAVLLFGFHDFDSSKLDENADTVASGFTASVNKGDVASTTSAGSSDGAYGPFEAGAGTANGFLNLSSGPPDTVFTLTNNTTDIYELEFLFFDMVRSQSSNVGAPFTLTVNYQNNGGASTAVVNPDTSGTTFGTFASITDNNTSPSAPGIDLDYTDRTGTLANILLGAGTSISFYFSTSLTNMRLDNIGVTGAVYVPPSGVPEPANFAALGGLLLSGLAIRSRRRPAKS
jgi:hypothetical protein